MKAAALAHSLAAAGPAGFEARLATNPKMTASGSRYEDEIWDLSGEMQGVRKRLSERRLDFRMDARGRHAAKSAFPAGKGLAGYPAFHRHAKQLLAAMILNPRNKLGPVFSAKTLINLLGGLRRIYCHFAAEGYDSLEAVPHRAFRAYAQKVDPYTSSFLAALRLIDLYRDRAPAFTFDVWPLAAEAPQASACVKKRFQSVTEPIPDPQFRQLLGVCLSFVQDRAPAILHAREALAAVRAGRPGRDRRYPSRESWRLHERVWSGIDLAAIYPEHAGDLVALQSAANVINACRDLQFAAAVLLFAITGMRLNELLTIRAGCLKKTKDGLVDRFWIESTHSKYADRAHGENARWLCGPMGAAAVAVLERLSAPTRQETGGDYLIGTIAEHGRHRIKNTRTRYGGGSANAFLSARGWWGQFLRRHHLAGFGSPPGHIHAHQFRRTFARWCALSDSGTGLLALQDHFKHASVAMTRHYAQIDDELLLMFEMEKDRIRAESFDRVLRTEALGGIGGHLIKRRIDTAIESGELPREFRGLAGAKLRFDCIKKWLESGVQLRACAGHYCVPIDPHVACAETSSLGCNKGTCRNAVFHPEHAAGLAEKIRQDRETLAKLADWAPGSAHVEQLREHVRIQEKILADIRPPSA
jgi:integrase